MLNWAYGFIKDKKRFVDKICNFLTENAIVFLKDNFGKDGRYNEKEIYGSGITNEEIKYFDDSRFEALESVEFGTELQFSNCRVHIFKFRGNAKQD